MAKTQVSVSPVLVEVARRRVAEAKAANREPSAATVLIANARVRSTRDTTGTTDDATVRVTRAKDPHPGRPTPTTKTR